MKDAETRGGPMSERFHVHPLPPGEACPHEECEYLRGHGSTRCACGQTRHAIASDWSGYSFGHSGGHVGFLTACAHCGRVDRGHIYGSPWTPRELAAARELAAVDAFAHTAKTGTLCPT